MVIILFSFLKVLGHYFKGKLACQLGRKFEWHSALLFPVIRIGIIAFLQSTDHVKIRDPTVVVAFPIRTLWARPGSAIVHRQMHIIG